MIKAYYLLTKPGIVFGNALTAIGGFFLAAKGVVNIWLFISMLLGLSFVIASSCVFNNYIDRYIDSKMSRTKNRALVKKVITGAHAILFAVILGVIGFSLLLFYTNILTTVIALIGFIFYVVIYGIWKRRSVHGTIIGSISGAVPPVVGYCAVTNQFDLAAALLFLILVVWQMPHFYAIAIFRSDDYKAASIPVLPVKEGFFQTKIHMLIYALLFILAVSSLTVFHYTGYIYTLVMIVFGIIWIYFILQGFKIKNEQQWARKIFYFSLLIIVVFSLLISVNNLIF